MNQMNIFYSPRFATEIIFDKRWTIHNIHRGEFSHEVMYDKDVDLIKKSYVNYRLNYIKFANNCVHYLYV